MLSPEEATQLAVAIAGLVAAVEVLKGQAADIEQSMARNGRTIKGLEYKALREKGQG